jgi:hypothetical protein
VDTVERVWRKNFADAAVAIPSSWLLTDEDGLMWINSDYSDTPLVRIYRSLTIVGYAKGWMP